MLATFRHNAQAGLVAGFAFMGEAVRVIGVANASGWHTRHSRLRDQIRETRAYSRE